MIHFLLGLALATGITIALTLFIQHQRDRRAARYHERRKRELLSQELRVSLPPSLQHGTPWWGWAMAPAIAAVALLVLNLAR